MKIDDLTFENPTYILDEKNTDIKKWRAMNPMNYFKALQLILSAGEQFPNAREIVVGEMFNAIYKVTRLYIPDVLYKFYSLTNDDEINDKKIKTLEQDQIFMSDIKDFNDPFDGKAFFYNPKQLKDIKRLSCHEGRIIDDFTKFHKGTAFTENDITCMPMWAHYSNNHQGFCVAYDMKHPKNQALSACTFPVQYTEQRLDITSFMREYANNISCEIDRQTIGGNKEILIKDISIIYVSQLLCYIKHSSWQYEKEFRCSMAANADGMPYVEAVPKAIYVGLKCNIEKRQELINIALQKNIPIFQMKFNDVSEEYELEAELIEH